MYRYFIIAIIAGIIGGIIARKKGYNQIVWFILCAIVPLLIVVILILPTKVAKGLTKMCYNCAEIIKEEAMFCKHCGYSLYKYGQEKNSEPYGKE